MTDLHTHILPGMDDGARNGRESLAMLRREWEQGVRSLALTSHFYPEQETPEEFLRRRAAASDALQRELDALSAEEREKLPGMILGAEVAWSPGIDRMSALERLCCGKSRYLLLELPSYPWHHGILDGLYDLMNRTELVPVLAHIDRYIPTQSPRLLRELFDLGLPMQISTFSLLHFRTRHSALKLLKQSNANYVISDCHDPDARTPNLGEAAAVLRRKLGDREAKAILDRADVFAEIC